MTTLTTARLVLRRARPDDLSAMHAVFSDPRATAYWSTLPYETLAQTAAHVDSMTSPDGDEFIVELEGRVIGKAGSWKLPEIGYILHPDVWGRGIATEALTAVIDHLFASHAVPALIADVDPRNAASVRVLEKLGFAETHRASNTYCIGGVWSDSVYLSLAREDWGRG